MPVFEYVTGEEMERLELLMATGDVTQSRADVEAFKIFVDTRTTEKFSVDNAMREAYDENLDEAVAVLSAPFFERLKVRALRNLRTRAASLSTPEIRKRIEQERETLAALEEMLSERNGDDEEPS